VPTGEETKWRAAASFMCQLEKKPSGVKSGEKGGKVCVHLIQSVSVETFDPRSSKLQCENAGHSMFLDPFFQKRHDFLQHDCVHKRVTVLEVDRKAWIFFWQGCIVHLTWNSPLYLRSLHTNLLCRLKCRTFREGLHHYIKFWL
jgi:hypothetical protein